MWSYSAKQFTQTALAPPIKLFIEAKAQKTASLVKWSCAKRDLTTRDENGTDIF